MAMRRRLSRLFRKETVMSFKKWRRQARILEAIRILVAGEQVSSIAFSLGYNSVSTFVAMIMIAHELLLVFVTYYYPKL